jgi:hypothetical protein
MAVAQKKERDASMAKYMKDHPGQFPDSILRPGRGEGAGIRKFVGSMSTHGYHTGTYDRGMLGGVLVARLGLGSANIPEELLT